ncbi:DUF2283 domain-containing protein [Streptomyces sp. NPDC054813]
MAEVEVTFDGEADAVYISLAEPQSKRAVARMYPCDPIDAGMINLDFDADGRLIGVEVLAARRKVPQYLLEAADRLDTDAE